jgi:hypothetical protein
MTLGVDDVVHYVDDPYMDIGVPDHVVSMTVMVVNRAIDYDTYLWLRIIQI